MTEAILRASVIPLRTVHASERSHVHAIAPPDAVRIYAGTTPDG